MLSTLASLELGRGKARPYKVIAGLARVGAGLDW
jgi:hypothetical protein